MATGYWGDIGISLHGTPFFTTSSYPYSSGTQYQNQIQNQTDRRQFYLDAGNIITPYGIIGTYGVDSGHLAKWVGKIADEDEFMRVKIDKEQSINLNIYE